MRVGFVARRHGTLALESAAVAAAGRIDLNAFSSTCFSVAVGIPNTLHSDAILYSAQSSVTAGRDEYPRPHRFHTERCSQNFYFRNKKYTRPKAYFPP